MIVEQLTPRKMAATDSVFSQYGFFTTATRGTSTTRISFNIQRPSNYSDLVLPPKIFRVTYFRNCFIFLLADIVCAQFTRRITGFGS